MDTKDYDHVKNLTLLFFLDRLMEKGQARTLHDLSCQFGTKGFTKEMRQIAGGSQSGLRKFFHQYPSLFTIEGDYVTVTNYNTGVHNPNDPTAKAVGKRDYAQEAVEYFIDKINQYGPGIEVPIRSLLGHRSQAPPEVRHVSGQHVKEFKDFLARYADIFVVREESESIILKKYENDVPQPFKEIELPVIDPTITNQIIHYCTGALMKGPIIIETLFNGLVSAFPESVWSQICRTSNDLATFLKMHSNLFNVQSNLVRLLAPSHTPAALKSQPQPLSFVNQSCQNEVVNIVNVGSGTIHTQKSSTPPQSLSYHSPPPSLQSPIPFSGSDSVNENIKSFSQTPCQGSPVRNQPSIQQQTLKTRVNNLLRKTLADNSEKDRVHFNYVGESSEHVTMRLLRNTRVIVSIRESRQIVNSILAARQPVSFDGEGVNLGPSGPMTLLQIGLVTGHIYIFDLIVERSLMFEGGLKELLESGTIVKVSHDCKGDAGALHHQFGVSIKNVFDTQAAHAVLQQQETGKPVYKVKNVSLNALFHAYNAPVNPRKDQMKCMYRRDQRFWARRPLTEEMIIYAAYDVAALVPTIYNAMKSQLDPQLDDLLLSLCHEQIDSLINPDEVKQKKKARKVETEIQELKTKLSTTTAKSVVLSNREIRLLRYLSLTDEEREKVKGSYKVDKKLEMFQNRKDRDDDSPDKNEEYSDEDDDDETEEYPSLSSVGSGGSCGSVGGIVSPREDNDNDNAEDSFKSLSFYDSMKQVDKVLNGNLERLDKIDRLEAILSAATQQSDPLSPVQEGKCCNCSCHSEGISPSDSPQRSLWNGCTTPNDSVDTPLFIANGSPKRNSSALPLSHAQCQTLSTGDIVITKVFFQEAKENNEKILN